MSLLDYEDLLSTVADYEADTGPSVTERLPELVTLAEARIFFGGGRPGDAFYTAPLRVNTMEKTAVIPIGPGLDGGTSGGTANAQTVTLDVAPTLSRGLSITFTAGFTNTGATTLNANATGATAIRKGNNRDELSADDILIDGIYTVYYDGTYYVLMPSDGVCPLPSRFLGHKGAYLQARAQVLTFAPTSSINPYMYGAVAGVPLRFAVEGSALRFEPLPDQNYKLRFTYYERPEPLVTALNDVFRDAPGIYLFGTLLELALYLPSPERAASYLSQYKSALDGYAASKAAAATSYAPMRVRLPIAP